MAMITRYVREGLLYTENDLQQIFEFQEREELNRFIAKLKQYRILKIKRFSGNQEDASILDEDDTDFIDMKSEKQDTKYLFRYVGILYCFERVIKVYPKYIESSLEPKSEMQQVIKVLQKYSKSKKEIVHNFLDDEGKSKSSLLSVIMFLLEDYFENGLYYNDEEIIELNGGGEIFWQKTIDEGYPIIKNNSPFYADLYTRKRISDEYDYFKRLHEAVIEDCIRQVKETELFEIFELPITDLSEECMEYFGDKEYILDRINSEMSQQFDDRKLSVLKALKEYIMHDGKMFKGDEEIVFYGTRSFSAVWEEVCSKVFKSQRNNKLKDLNPSPQIDYLILNKDYDTETPITGNLELVHLIKKPEWHVEGYTVKADNTFLPDYLSFDLEADGYHYYILDAKYYCPEWTAVGIKKNPGVEDVAKQYLYYFAYKMFLDRVGVSSVKNYFLMPKETGEIEKPGYVKLDIWRSLNVQPGNIGIRRLPADRLYAYYLKEKTINLSELK